MIRSAPLALMAFLFSPVLWASPTAWHALRSHSHIDFTAYWQKTPVRGRFARFDVAANIDPAHPGGGTITVRILTTALKTQSPDIARALRESDWFDTARYPRASFTSAVIKANANESLAVSGILRLKGHAKKIRFPMTITRIGTDLRLAGKFPVNRNDFAIGSGRWAGASIIATRVTVSFSVLLAPDQ